MSSRRPTAAAIEVETALVERSTCAGQGNRSRARQHGDLATYQWGLSGKDRANGCRCDTCVDGNRAYKRRYARDRYRRNKGGGFIRLNDIRPHIHHLLRLGWQIKQIADRAQITTNTVTRIASTGDANDDVKRHIARALLAIPPVAWHRQRRHELDQALLERASDIAAGRWAPVRDISRYLERDRWKAQAACAGLDPESTQLGRGDSLVACRALCDACPVNSECGEAGLYERFGVWGGISERARRKLRRDRGIYLIDDAKTDADFFADTS